MKNLNNDKSMQNNLETTVFDNLPTAEEAERMEAEAGGANEGVFNEQAVTAMALAGMNPSLMTALYSTAWPNRK